MARASKSSSSQQIQTLSTASAFSAHALAQATNAAKTAHDYIFPQWSGLDPSQVGQILTAYQLGDFQFAVPYLEAVLAYDAQISTCFRKRIASTASRDWEIQIEQGTPESEMEQAQAQAQALRDFYNSISVRSSFALDAEQGISALVEHTLGAIALGYSASALTFVPAKTGVRAVATTAPLRLFEARERKLRIRTNYGDTCGKDMNPKQWLIANTQQPLALPSLILFCLKSTPQEDWAQVVEKFGTPFVILKTPAPRGSDEWKEAVSAAPKIGTGFSAALGSDVEIQTFPVAQGNAPHERLVEYIDRETARLWLGGDLSTMSRENGIGSNAQSADTVALLKSDARFVERVFDTQLTRRVLDLVFGIGAKQLAFFKFSDDAREDVSAIIAKIQAAKEIGLDISKDWAYNALGIPAPRDGEETVGASNPAVPAQTQENGSNSRFPAKDEETLAPDGKTRNSRDFDAKNASTGTPNDRLPRSVKDAQRDAFREPVDYLNALERAEDDAAFYEILNKFEEAFPQIAEEIIDEKDVPAALARELQKTAKQAQKAGK